MRPDSTILAAVLLLGCPPTMDDDDTVIEDCPAEDRFTSDADPCFENFCGEPVVWPATGNSADTFRELSDGDELPIWYGSQGGYHLELAFRSTNLCPVVFADFELYDVTAGAETLLHSSTRHVQTVRGGDPPSNQRWWTEQFRFPCQYWPDDPENDPFCGVAPVAFLDQLDLALRVATRDHNEATPRSATAAVRVSATCCN